MVDWIEVFNGKWRCPKCGSTSIIVNEHTFTGSGFTRLLDWQAYEYVAVTCKRCGYTEFYSRQVLGDESTALQILDLLFGR